MTTIRDKQILRDYVSPYERMRRFEPKRLSPPVWPIVVVLMLLATYAAPDLIAWAHGDVPVVVGRMK